MSRIYILRSIAKKFQEFQGKTDNKKDAKKVQKESKSKEPKKEAEEEDVPKPKERDPFATLPEG